MPVQDTALEEARRFISTPAVEPTASSELDPLAASLQSAREAINLPPGGEFPKRILGEFGPGFGAGVELSLIHISEPTRPY